MLYGYFLILITNVCTPLNTQVPPPPPPRGQWPPSLNNMIYVCMSVCMHVCMYLCMYLVLINSPHHLWQWPLKHRLLWHWFSCFWMPWTYQHLFLSWHWQWPLKHQLLWHWISCFWMPWTSYEIGSNNATSANDVVPARSPDGSCRWNGSHGSRLALIHTRESSAKRLPPSPNTHKGVVGENGSRLALIHTRESSAKRLPSQLKFSNIFFLGVSGHTDKFLV